jgi:hypothetical protein
MTTLAAYLPKTTPWKHQAEIFAATADLEYHAVFAEPRTGKTKIVLDTAAYRFEQNDITALLVVAMPSGVPRNWVTDEVPAHLPDRVPRRCLVWSAASFAKRAYQAELEALLTFPGLAVLAVNGEAVITANFRRYLARFLKARQKIMVCADESTLLLKTPGAKRAKVLHAIGARPEAVVRRILDGTPLGEGPLDLYSQLHFLKPGLLGHHSFFSYKQHYAEWEQKTVYDPRTGQTRAYPELKSYRNLDELSARLARVSSRVTRREVFPNMPDQVITPLYLQLSQEQRRVYDALREEYEAELDDLSTITAANVLTRYLRLQQISSNWLPERTVLAICPACRGDGCEACDDLGALEAVVPARRVDTSHNPRLDALADQLSRTSEPFLVWCRFTGDVDDCLALAERLGRSPVRYDGRCTADEKATAKAAFQAGDAGCMIGNPASGGRGLTLRAAKTIFNYSHFFSLLVYVQGNDRAEDPDATRGTVIVDLVAEDTVDEEIALAHASKLTVTQYVMARRAEGRSLFR